jgi:hypothetical protein
VGEAINRTFLAAYEQVGRFSSLQVSGRGYRAMHGIRPRKLGGNVVTYFCTPDRNVLFFTVGPVESTSLLVAAQWADATFSRLTRATAVTAEERSALLREAHLNAAQAESRAEFQKLFASRWPKEPQVVAGPADLETLVAAARNACDAARRKFIDKETSAAAEDLNGAQQANRLGTWPRMFARQSAEHQRQAARLQTELKHRAKLQAISADVAHLILSELPLATLADLQEVVFERLAGQVYLPRSARNEVLLEAVRQVRSGKVPLVLLIGRYEDKQKPGEIQIPTQSLALLRMKAIARLLAEFETLELTLDELTILMDDLDEQPLPSLHGESPSFAIFNSAGGPVATLGRMAKASDLSGALKRALSSNGGKKETADRETVAARELALARQLFAENPTAAERRLRNLVEKHPGTAAAARATQLLRQVED